MSKCNICGCVYNDDGECLYDVSPIQMSYERACYEREFWSDDEE